VERGEGRRGINFPEMIQKGNKEIKGDKRERKRKKGKGWTKCINVDKPKEEEK